MAESDSIISRNLSFLFSLQDSDNNEQYSSSFLSSSSLSSSSCLYCGWIGAAVAALAYGSYGVPIKETLRVQVVHPLVLQSYKTIVVFLSSWLVLLLGVKVQKISYYWGFLSGLFWVIGGTGGIYGIRNAGMAVAIGTWASVMIIVNFIFGILIFQEPIHDIWGTFCAFVLLIVGLIGMSHFSSPQQQDQQQQQQQQSPVNNNNDNDDQASMDSNNYLRYGDEPSTTSSNQFSELVGSIPDEDDELLRELGSVLLDESTHSNNNIDLSPAHDNNNQLVLLLSLFVSKCCCVCSNLSKRQGGILGAIINGIFTGSSLIPLHYANQEGLGGATFMISIGIGSLLANIILWLLYVVGQCIQYKTFSIPTIIQNHMPCWHVEQLWFRGAIAGCFLSLAMFGSIFAVTYLGQGIGNSLVQCKILISGLWGIFWYNEIKGIATIFKWFTFAFITVIAIVWLTLERMEAK